MKYNASGVWNNIQQMSIWHSGEGPGAGDTGRAGGPWAGKQMAVGNCDQQRARSQPRAGFQPLGQNRDHRSRVSPFLAFGCGTEGLFPRWTSGPGKHASLWSLEGGDKMETGNLERPGPM